MDRLDDLAPDEPVGRVGAALVLQAVLGPRTAVDGVGLVIGRRGDNVLARSHVDDVALTASGAPSAQCGLIWSSAAGEVVAATGVDEQVETRSAAQPVVARSAVKVVAPDPCRCGPRRDRQGVLVTMPAGAPQPDQVVATPAADVVVPSERDDVVMACHAGDVVGTGGSPERVGLSWSSNSDNRHRTSKQRLDEPDWHSFSRE